MEKNKISAGVVPYRIVKKYIEVLLLNNGEYWGFPKGNVEEGETKIFAAVRELYEKTHLKPLVISLNPVSTTKYVFESNQNILHKTVYFYAGIIDERSEVLLSEGYVDFEWVSVNKARTELCYHNLSKILDLGISWMESDDYAAEFLIRNLQLMR